MAKNFCLKRRFVEMEDAEGEEAADANNGNDSVKNWSIFRDNAVEPVKNLRG